jgi:hypothetical protein
LQTSTSLPAPAAQSATATPTSTAPADLSPTASSTSPAALGSNTGADPATAELSENALHVLVGAREGDLGRIDPETQCLAKVIRHEAANQSLQGQLAVAQVILNRVHTPSFPKSICAVVNQPGQFFDLPGYVVRVTSMRWRRAVAIARIAREQATPEVAPGALFYHAAYVRPAWSHRRTRIAQIGEHIFYR